jgi:hypothetical protein
MAVTAKQTVVGSGAKVFITPNVETVAGYTPTLDRQLADKGYVDSAIARNRAYGIIDGIYDNAGTANTIRSTTFAIGDVALAIEAVGTFIANRLYKCSAAGTILTGTFEEFAPSEGLLIISQYELINPNDGNVIYLADNIYSYDTDTNNWLIRPQLDSIAPGTAFAMSCVIEYTDSGTPVSLGIVPVNTVVDGIDNLSCEISLDGTGAALSVGDASDNSKILGTSTLYTGLHGFAQGTCTGEVPLSTTTFTPIVYTNRTELFAYFSVTGANQGKFHLVLKCRKI